jgi:hypothetical protein
VDSISIDATLSVDLPPAEAILLFTPEGERLWAEGWDPTYPAGTPSAAPGTVFVTGGADRQTVWTIVDSSADRMRYARVAPDDAGTVEVAVVASNGVATTLVVRYELTALNDVGRAGLVDFDTEYADYIGSWETAVRRALTTVPV